MPLAEQIDADIKEALKAGDQARLSTLRLLKNGLDAAAKQKQAALEDAEVVKVIQKELKQRRDSIDSYTKGGRSDLAEKEEAEVGVLEAYLPAQISEQELAELVEAAIKETGATGMSDMGKVMGALTPKLAGAAEPGQVAQLVKQRLSQT